MVPHQNVEAYVRDAARKMLMAALEEAVSSFLKRQRYERGEKFRGYRNGYHLPREITVDVGPVDVQVSRVSKIPPPCSTTGISVKDSAALPAGLKLCHPMLW